MKAWIVREKDEFCATVVFAETRGKARAMATHGNRKIVKPVRQRNIAIHMPTAFVIERSACNEICTYQHTPPVV